MVVRTDKERNDDRSARAQARKLSTGSSLLFVLPCSLLVLFCRTSTRRSSTTTTLFHLSARCHVSLSCARAFQDWYDYLKALGRN